MAIRTQPLYKAFPGTGARTVEGLAALPTGTIVAVFDSRVDAVGTAVQLAVDAPESRVWLATGADAATSIRAARAARSFFKRMFSGLSDDEVFVKNVIAEATRDRTVLVVQPKDSRSALSWFAGARHVVEFGRWTTRPIR